MSAILEVKQINVNVTENGKNHNTDNFDFVRREEKPIPVLRRGQIFKIDLTFTGRSYDQNRDVLKLIFDFGPQPMTLKGTRGVMTVDVQKKSANTGSSWNCGVLAHNSESLSLEIYSPSDCPVGIWKLKVETSGKNWYGPKFVCHYGSDIFILFNPWNKDDSVYMPEKKLLDEYVLEDVGKIWIGPHGTCRGREWGFGQYDAYVLSAIMFMFERSGLDPSSRGDPVKVSRVISKMVNSNDDGGILRGRWDGEYDDGTQPSAWTGSIEILEQYVKYRRPVMYGQCWVFAGVVTTICRALGIPSRVVSNLVSAHDKNSTLSVDKYYSKETNKLYGSDSIWNFHVWNDVWMARPDLPSGFGGWQAIDSTPQEKSDRVYQCGPASLEAIKRGEIGFNYDVAFMIATVNADYMIWKEDPDSDFGYSKISNNKQHIGRFILTKKPFMYDPNGDKDRDDITLEYKAKEGTQDERSALMKAVEKNAKSKRYEASDAAVDDVEFNLQKIDRINLRDEFNVIVKMVNKTDAIRTIALNLLCESVIYTGNKKSLIKTIEIEDHPLAPHKSDELKMIVKPDDYLDKLEEYWDFKISAIAAIKETKQYWADEDDFQIVKPKLEIEIPSSISINKEVNVKLKFKNPLNKTLTNCKFQISAPSMFRSQVLMFPKNIEPGGIPIATTKIKATNKGKRTVVATFFSKELVDVTGSVVVEVSD